MMFASDTRNADIPFAVYSRLAFAGVSQVSVAMKMRKAHWVSDTLQHQAACIEPTNSVHAHCRWAISAMQSTPNQS